MVEHILPQLMLQAGNADVIIAGIMNDEQAALVQQISMGTKTPVIVIAFGVPLHTPSLSRCLRVPRRL